MSMRGRVALCRIRSGQAYASFWAKDPPARVAVQVAALAGNASVPWLLAMLQWWVPFSGDVHMP